MDVKYRSEIHPVNLTVATNIKTKRTEAGIKAEIMADALGLTDDQYYAIESGFREPQIIELFWIYKMLEQDAGFLFEGLN